MSDGGTAGDQLDEFQNPMILERYLTTIYERKTNSVNTLIRAGAKTISSTISVSVLSFTGITN